MVHTLVQKKIERESMSESINQVEPNISNEDIDSVNQYISSGAWITEHSVTKQLEEEISHFVDRKYAVAVPNGTIAIYLSLLASGLTKGKRVAVPNITMIATINAIIWAGADPVIVDVNERLCMSLTSLQKVEKLDGVIYVPLNGRTEEGLKIEKYCRDNEIVLIEDSAHALGSNYENKKCGSLADLSIFSFTPHKIITMGQGGMILTDNDELYDYLFNIKTFNRSKDKSDLHEGFGLNFKITDLQSALGLSQFKKLNQFIKIKQDISNLYSSYIDQKYFVNFLDGETPWFIDLVCKSKSQRDGLNTYLQEKNIITRDSYPALSSQFYLSNVEKVNLDYSEKISEKILWLPSSTNLTNKQIKNISEEINFFLNQN